VCLFLVLVARDKENDFKEKFYGKFLDMGPLLWGSISYALKAPDIPPIKLKTWREPSWDHPKPGESEAENNICMCVQ